MPEHNIQAVTQALVPLKMLDVERNDTKVAIIKVESVTAPDTTEPSRIDAVVRYIILHKNGDLNYIEGGLKIIVKDKPKLTDTSSLSYQIAALVKPSIASIIAHVKQNEFDISSFDTKLVSKHFNDHLVDVTVYS